jgi:ABC-type taurine transport system substrate-binding protein
MGRRLRLQLRAGKALYDKACREAGAAFAEGRLDDALSVYKAFAKENPDVHADEIRSRISALEEYIADRAKRQQASPSTAAPC